MVLKRIALFASGNGSNALNIIDYFKNSKSIEVAFLLSNKKDAPVIQKATDKGVKVHVISNENANDAVTLIDLCQAHQVDSIILAGYLRKIPAGFIQEYDQRIINIHPSLLPKYGGKGMYGNFVHEAVIQQKEAESGITIHFVNENFDEGKLIAQFHCSLQATDTVEVLQAKIHQLEQAYFPHVIEQTLINT